MTRARTLSSLRHLCSLGIPGEALVPEFFATLNELVPADVHTFVWHDAAMQPVRLYTSSIEVGVRMADLRAFLGGLHVTEATWHRVKAAAMAGAPHQLLDRVYGFLGDEIRKPLGMPHEDVRFLPDVGGSPGSTNLWRSGRKGFTAAELATLKSAYGYLDYALASPRPASEGSYVEDGAPGVVLLDASGRLLQTDEIANRLLPLAVDGEFGSDFRQNSRLIALWHHLCMALARLSGGCPGPMPAESQRNAWGVFRHRASWLQRPQGGSPGVVAVTVTLSVPRRIKLWRAIHALDLPPRRQAVAMLFAEGMAQQEIAKRLGIARTTVIDHIRHVYDRLGIPASRTALAAALLGERDASC